jgi:hypothetical protein
MFGIFHDADAELLARLKRLEHKVDLILDKLGIEDTTGPSDRVRRLAAEGRKIEAIKAYREEMGGGLKEAKDAVEGIVP